MKRILALLIVSLFVFSSIGMCAEEAAKSIDKPTVPPYDNTKDRLSRGMNNLLYGPTEVPKNIDETRTKGEQMTRCSTKTRSGVERGIARIVSGAWQLATFWYSDPGCVTKAPQSSTPSGSASAK